MPVLITPVWVVIVVVGEPVSLICRCSLSASFGRVTPGREAQRVTVHPFLLYSEEIGESIVEGSLYISTVCPAIGQSGSDSPTFLIETAGIGV